jgi:hypothetical protein
MLAFIVFVIFRYCIQILVVIILYYRTLLLALHFIIFLWLLQVYIQIEYNKFIKQK